MSDRQKKRRLSKALENDLQQLISNNKSIISVNHSPDVCQSDIDPSSVVYADFPDGQLLNNDLEETEPHSSSIYFDLYLYLYII